MADFPGHQKPRGIAAAADAEAAAGFVQMAVDRVLGDAQAAGDLLGMKVPGDQAKALPFTRGQSLYRRRVVLIPHKRTGKCAFPLSSIPLVKSLAMRH